MTNPMKTNNKTAETKTMILCVYSTRDINPSYSKSGSSYYKTYNKGVNSLLTEGWEYLDFDTSERGICFLMSKEGLPMDAKEENYLYSKHEIGKEEYERNSSLPF